MTDYVTTFGTFFRTLMRSNERTTVHFFQKEHSFNLYGLQAVQVAHQFYKTTNVLRKEGGLEVLSLSKKLFFRVAIALLDKNFSIQTWIKSNTGMNIWDKKHFASPGHISDLESEIGIVAVGDLSSCSTIIAIFACASSRLGCVVADSVFSVLTFLEFSDTIDFCWYGHLLGCLSNSDVLLTYFTDVFIMNHIIQP